MKPGLRPVTHTVHYPSTAELALFRGDLHDQFCDVFGPCVADEDMELERVVGIGYRGSQHSFADDLSGAMSRWASEERSAAYERMTK